MLNSNLDLHALCEEFSTNHRILIKDAFTEDSAKQLLNSLETEIPWQMAYMNGDVTYLISQQELQALTQQQAIQNQQRIIQQAKNGFQFYYGHYSVIGGENLAECSDEAFVLQVRDYMQTDAFFQFVKTLTGNDEINKLELLAARYNPGNFLLTHDDFRKPERRFAYVLNLSKDWKVEWGGLLHFLDEKGQLLDTYVPTYNSLTIFKVPASHTVSYVAPYAGRTRYSITGWFTV